MTQENTAYLVGYCYGFYDGFTTHVSFVTFDEEKAKAYCEKFRRVLAKYFQHQMDRPYGGFHCYHFHEDMKPWYTKTKLK